MTKKEIDLLTGRGPKPTPRMNSISAQLTLREAHAQRGHWENVIERIWRDAAKAEIVFLLKKGKMHQTACKIVSVGWFDRVEIRRLDNGKTYSIHPSFLKWPNSEGESRAASARTLHPLVGSLNQEE